MEKKMEVFLNQIGINEDYITYFENSEVEKVVINKTTNRFHFFIKIEKIIPLNVYEDLLSSLKESFHHEVNLSLNYLDNNYELVKDGINGFLVKNKNEAINAINHFLQNRDSIIQMGKCSRKIY